MAKWIKKYIPTKESIKKYRELKGLKPFLKSSSFWAFDCQSVARGVAAGLAGSVIPGFQIFYAAILVILLRGNLPIALLATFITNPFTAIPIVYFIHYVGTLIIGSDHSTFVVQNFNWHFSSFHAFWSNLSTWMLQFGKEFFIGVPIVSLGLGVIGYIGTILAWKIYFFIRAKKKSKN